MKKTQKKEERALWHYLLENFSTLPLELPNPSQHSSLHAAVASLFIEIVSKVDWQTDQLSWWWIDKLNEWLTANLSELQRPKQMKVNRYFIVSAEKYKAGEAVQLSLVLSYN